MRIGHVLVGVLLSVSALACATAELPIETASGERPGDYFAPFQIIGVSRAVMTTLNVDRGVAVREESITVPVGTELILPSIQGWLLQYGSRTENTVAAHTGVGGPVVGARPDDHEIWRGEVQIFVKDINAPNFDMSPPTQTATLGFRLHLADYNFDDEWFGNVWYHLVFLSRCSAAPRACAPIKDFKPLGDIK